MSDLSARVRSLEALLADSKRMCREHEAEVERLGNERLAIKVLVESGVSDAGFREAMAMLVEDVPPPGPKSGPPITR